jgi:hypothetical protein
MATFRLFSFSLTFSFFMMDDVQDEEGNGYFLFTFSFSFRQPQRRN